MLFAGAAAAISAGCLIPARWLPLLPNDKLMHFMAFGGLALLAGSISESKNEFSIWLLGLFFAGWLIEGLQNLVPGRKFCWRDLAANTAGILFAMLFSFHLDLLP
jgi:VanZ family protein